MEPNHGPTENEVTINTVSEIPSQPFRLTMEVPLFLLMLGLSISGAVINNIILLRTCLHSLHYNEEQCNSLHMPGDKSNETKLIEEEVQKYATFVTMVRSVIEAVFPAITSLFLGVWSDTYGRKPLIVWPLFGISMSSMMVVVYGLMNSLGPWWYVLTAVPVSLSGGLTALFTGSFSYVSDITSSGSRSFRLSLLEAAVFLGSILGSLLSSYLVALVGNTMVLLIHSAIYVAAYVFTNMYVRESLTGALSGSFCSIIDFLLVKEMMTTCFKKRPNKMRSIILLLVFANSFSVFILYGITNLEYLYTREKLEWDLKIYTIFNASSTLILVVGLFIGVMLVQKMCRVGDLPLTILSYFSSIADVVIKAFAVKTWHMYLGASVCLFRGLAAPLTRSILTKILPVEDIAKVFALTCSLEAILPVFSPIIYNLLYSTTITVFPGAVFMLSGGIFGCCMVMVMVVQFYMYKYPVTSYSPLTS